MKLTNEEYSIIDSHLDEIKRIIINSSCSSLSIELRQAMTEIGVKYKLMQKASCSTCLYLAIARLYDWYKLDKKEIELIAEAEAAKVEAEAEQKVEVKPTKTKRKSNGKKES